MFALLALVRVRVCVCAWVARCQKQSAGGGGGERGGSRREEGGERGGGRGGCRKNSEASFAAGAEKNYAAQGAETTCRLSVQHSWFKRPRTTRREGRREGRREDVLLLLLLPPPCRQRIATYFISGGRILQPTPPRFFNFWLLLILPSALKLAKTAPFLVRFL